MSIVQVSGEGQRRTFDGSQVQSIAEQVFSAMIDDDPSALVLWAGLFPDLEDSMDAWVDVTGPWTGRVALTTELTTAHDLSRALLGMGPEEPVGDDDVADAFGEVANVVGGNVKTLLTEVGRLGLPQVADAAPPMAGTVLHELRMAWRGRPLAVIVTAAE
ncbi:chemotaxis protein CheX [Cellulomonas cellasea]|uniref:chemotaxis protein CheX n=1 Tax=Cellulomonas cellasea TaxID=43670 RepID=UPI0025A3D686|nr:chemotaxis protein CheX [Cellulomonas cellasea]MDM8083362.1 chemotaxis protein CheX [Cellulomonas cellasea]